MIQPHVTLIIKVTNACDMKCRYCFIEPSVFHKTMKPETARRVVRSFLDSDYFQSVQFVWHGGEPLLRGRRFFETLLDEQKSRTTSVCYTNSTQTNATHLSDDMLDFLLANDIRIGLSLDGPEKLNDASREMHRSTDERSPGQITVDAARRLQQRGQEAAAIVTVNRNNWEHADDVYHEFKRRRIHMKINPLTRSGLAATVTGSDLGVSAEEYGTFLVRMFDLWFDDPEPSISIEPFRQHIARIMGVETVQSCFFTLHCHRFFFGVSPDGDLFPCGMFQGEPTFRYGNIHDMQPEDVSRTLLFNQLEVRALNVLKTCSECAFYDLCYSGCMFHSLKDSRVLEQKDYYCAGYKMYFEHALRRVHADLVPQHTLPAQI